MPGLGLGFSLQQKEGLLIPWYITNEDPMREALSREAGFSFPLAAAGFFIAGPFGVVVGHVVGAAVGYIRHQRIHGA